LERIKITTKGQITLPKSLREKLKLEKGDYLDAFIYSNSLVLKPVPRQSGKEIILEYCKRQSSRRVSLERASQILAKVPFSLTERVGKLREEE